MQRTASQPEARCRGCAHVQWALDLPFSRSSVADLLSRLWTTLIPLDPDCKLHQFYNDQSRNTLQLTKVFACSLVESVRCALYLGQCHDLSCVGDDRPVHKGGTLSSCSECPQSRFLPPNPPFSPLFSSCLSLVRHRERTIRFKSKSRLSVITTPLISVLSVFFMPSIIPHRHLCSIPWESKAFPCSITSRLNGRFKRAFF